jgi:hypothetical protein
MINTQELEALFDKHKDEYNHFERIQTPLHSRPDLTAYLLLDKLVPGTKDMISFAKHDQYSTSIHPDDFCKVATEEDVITLIRCGMMFDEEMEFSFFA